MLFLNSTSQCGLWIHQIKHLWAYYTNFVNITWKPLLSFHWMRQVCFIHLSCEIIYGKLFPKGNKQAPFRSAVSVNGIMYGCGAETTKKQAKQVAGIYVYC